MVRFHIWFDVCFHFDLDFATSTINQPALATRFQLINTNLLIFRRILTDADLDHTPPRNCRVGAAACLNAGYEAVSTNRAQSVHQASQWQRVWTDDLVPEHEVDPVQRTDRRRYLCDGAVRDR